MKDRLPRGGLGYDAWKRALAGERLPLAAVDLDAFDRNVARVKALAEGAPPGTRLRVASKSLRVPALLRRVLDQGPPFRGVMAYAAREIELLAAGGFDDFLLAYPTAQRHDHELLLRLHQAGKTVRAVIDSAEAAALWGQVARGVVPAFPLLVELDCSLRLLGGRTHLGVRRSPVRDLTDMLAVVEAIARHEGLRFGGIMAYEAQVAGLADRNPFTRLVNPAVAWVRRRSRREVAARRRTIAEGLRARGIALELFNGGGTGSLGFALPEPWLTEITAGSGFVGPSYFDWFSNLGLEPALCFALQVVRKSDPGYVTCQGGGFIASGDPGWHRVPRPWLPEGLTLLPNEGCGEVQTPLRGEACARLQLGDPVLLRHAKAGELAEHFAEYVLVAGGTIVGRVPTYRGLARCWP